MAEPAPQEITRLLEAWRSGDPSALEALTPMIYGELRRIAKRYMRKQPPQTLQTTALAHEAYLKLVGAADLRWQDRVHFFAVAAQMMRRILVDAARARAAAKRLGGDFRVTFSEDLSVGGGQDINVMVLDEALES